MIIVVTGTDTEVGKTVVTAAVACRFAARGLSVGVVKPAQTGVGADEPGDLHEVARLSGVSSLHEGVRLPDPLAPDVAARVAGHPLPSVQEQQELVRRVDEAHDVTIVEGAGGLLVRLGVGYTLLDVMAPYDCRWIVVGRAGLGSLNHSELTVEALRRREQVVAGVVIGSWPATPGLAEQQNLFDLPRITGVPLLGSVPEGAASMPVEEFRRVAPDWIAI